MNARKKAKMLKKEYQRLSMKIRQLEGRKNYVMQMNPVTEREKKMYENLCKYMMMVGIGTKSGMRISEEMLYVASKRQIDWEHDYLDNSIIVRCR